MITRFYLVQRYMQEGKKTKKRRGLFSPCTPAYSTVTPAYSTVTPALSALPITDATATSRKAGPFD
jgi:hypothetical protein